MDIHTRQLRYFMELARCLNFTKAAMNLYIAQPALSQQIADLEKQLGVTLFTRSSRSVILTPAGKILWDSCPDILASLENVNQKMLLCQAGFLGSLKLGYLDSFRHLLPEVLHHFGQLYPNVTVELYRASLQDLKNALKNNTIDVAFGLINQKDFPADSPPSYNILRQEDLCLVVQEDHPFVTSGCKDFSLLESDVLYFLAEESSPSYPLIVQDACTAVGLRMQRRTPAYSVPTIVMQVEAGLGISMLPASVEETLSVKRLRFLPIQKDKLSFGALWNDHSKSAVLPLFLDVLEKTVDAVPDR